MVRAASAGHSTYPATACDSLGTPGTSDSARSSVPVLLSAAGRSRRLPPRCPSGVGARAAEPRDDHPPACPDGSHVRHCGGVVSRAPEGRGSGAGSGRRNRQAANAIKRCLRATRDAVAVIEVHVIAPVRNASAISKAVGISVTGYAVVLENGTARHTLRRHGDARAEARRGQLAVTEDDFALLPQILCEFDRVEAADATKQGVPQARFHKRIGIVEYEVFAAVRQRAEQVAFKTMLKRRAREEASS